MNDREIRIALLAKLRSENRRNKAVIIEEFGLQQGSSRIDIAVINGSIQGYEIKSEKDNLDRLQGQAEIYSRVLDYVTIVASSKHVNDIKKMIPEWWGLKQVFAIGNKATIRTLRAPSKNPNIDATSVAQLLWRDEALDLLRKYQLNEGVLSKPRKILWQRLIDGLELDRLRNEVRNKIKSRQNWRFVEQQK